MSLSLNLKDLGGQHPSLLRRLNAIQVFQAIRLEPGITQRRIGAASGIDRTTVSAIIAYFDSCGLLRRRADDSVKRRGRPTELLELRSEVGLLIGIHITSSKLQYVASGIDGNPFATAAYPPTERASDVHSKVDKFMDDFLATIGRTRQDISAVGIAVPGLVSSRGKLAESSNLQWNDIDMSNLLSQQVNGRILIDNDSRAAGIAEKLFGKCVNVDDFVFVNGSTGVGGVLFLDGKAYVGAGGFAGEVGHVKVAHNGRLCTCGDTGCLSAYVSETALLGRLMQLGITADSYESIRKLAAMNDEQVLLVLEEAGEMLGIALADFVNLFNPPLIVLGGGLAKLAPYLLPAAERSAQRHSLASSKALCTIVVSELASESTPKGSLALALTALMEPTTDTAFPW